MDSVSIIMATRNKAEFLKLSLRAIVDSLDPSVEHEFLILDNGSSDETGAVIDDFSERHNQISGFRLDENIGLNGYSYLYERASGDMIVTVDDDVIYVTPYWERIFSTVLHSTFAGMRFAYIGADTVNKDGGITGIVSGFADVAGITIRLTPAGGWLAASTRDAIAKIGGFHSDKDEMYLEDADFQRRAQHLGYLYGIAEPVRVFHARSPGYYKALGHKETYIERMILADAAGVDVERMTF